MTSPVTADFGFRCGVRRVKQILRHPFASKLSLEQADEVRRLRRDGAAVADLAARYGIAKSSVSAIVHLHAHVPDGVVRVALPDFEHALLVELAADEDIPVEQFASDLLCEALRSRDW